MSLLTSLCMRVAQWLLGGEGEGWARAMCAELAHLPSGRERLSWAFGCLAASIKQRFTAMNTGSFRISRWVMLIEAFGLFGPLTLAWYEFILGPSGLVRLDAQIVEKVFLNQPNGLYTLMLWYAVALTGVVGAIGLFLGLRYALTGQALRNRALGISLIAVLLLPTLAGVVLSLIMGPVGPEPNFGIFLMLAALPAVGIGHLLYLAKPSEFPPDATVARPAI
jgi:hypothetical protein